MFPDTFFSHPITGLVGKYKQVDKRMLADQRGEKLSAKRAKKRAKRKGH